MGVGLSQLLTLDSKVSRWTLTRVHQGPVKIPGNRNRESAVNLEGGWSTTHPKKYDDGSSSKPVFRQWWPFSKQSVVRVGPRHENLTPLTLIRDAPWSSRWFDKPECKRPEHSDLNTRTYTQQPKHSDQNTNQQMYKWSISVNTFVLFLFFRIHVYSNYLYTKTCYLIAYKAWQNLCQISILNTFWKSQICTQTLIQPENHIKNFKN